MRVQAHTERGLLASLIFRQLDRVLHQGSDAVATTKPAYKDGVIVWCLRTESDAHPSLRYGTGYLARSGYCSGIVCNFESDRSPIQKRSRCFYKASVQTAIRSDCRETGSGRAVGHFDGASKEITRGTTTFVKHGNFSSLSDPLASAGEDATNGGPDNYPVSCDSRFVNTYRPFAQKLQ